ncbi:signal peptidase I [Olsenella phocaeensis]|uniref:signal peptidase I n=1 Tax=Olsenella phocaeensis TaxID=1852385 RepID=UPI000AA5CFA7|nr:signal peptidase I [Olsenella phocaeensis]
MDEHVAGGSGAGMRPTRPPRHGRAMHLHVASSDKKLPTIAQVQHEYERVQRQRGRGRVAKNTVAALATVFAVSVLGSLLAFPLFRIFGDSMTPTLSEGDVVLAVKGGDLHVGDLMAFSYNNKVLVKRVIAREGDWVNIDQDGIVSVNGQELDEGYLRPGTKSLGQCDIPLPYQVPEGKYFVMGDHRSMSVDSRTSQVGCISSDQVAGKLVLRVWPPASFGTME